MVSNHTPKYQREWRKKNKNKTYEYRKRYGKKHPEVIKAKEQRNKEKKSVRDKTRWHNEKTGICFDCKEKKKTGGWEMKTEIFVVILLILLNVSLITNVYFLIRPKIIPEKRISGGESFEICWRSYPERDVGYAYYPPDLHCKELINNYEFRQEIIPVGNYKEKVYGTDDVVWGGRYFASNGSFVEGRQPMGIKFDDDGWKFEVYNPNGVIHAYRVEERFNINSNPVYIGDRVRWEQEEFQFSPDGTKLITDDFEVYDLSKKQENSK